MLTRIPHLLLGLIVYRPVEVYVCLLAAPVADQDRDGREEPFIVTRSHMGAVLAGVLYADSHRVRIADG